MDLTRYSTLKSKGLITLAKVGNAHAATMKQFSPEDGHELETETEAIDQAELVLLIAKRKIELESLKELLADLPL